LQLDVAGSIGGTRARLEEILACALRYHHDGMAALEDPLFEDSQETAASVETKWDFRDKGKVPLLNFEWAINRGNNKVCCYCVYPVELWAGRSAVHKSTG
jgi:hypothetical protein